MENEEDIKRQEEEKEQGSQGFSPVGRFGFSPSNKKETESLKNRIEGSRSRNLSDTNKGEQEVNSTPSSGGSGLGPNPSIEDDDGKSGGLFSSLRKRIKGGSSSSESGIGASSSLGSSIGSDILGGETKATGASGIGSKLSNLFGGGKKAANGAKAVKEVATASAKVEAIAAFFASPIGIAILAVVGVFVIIILFAIIFPMVISSLEMKFGLTGDETLDVFNEEYKEALSREDVEEIMEDYEKENPVICEEGIFDKIKHFFDIWDLSDNCELKHYIDKMLKDKERVKSITTISPGYFMSSLYYAFDTQNYDENGELYIKPTKALEDKDENSIVPADIEYVNDLDAITTLMGVDIYDKDTLDTLLDNYIFHNYYTYYVLVRYKKKDGTGYVEVCESRSVNDFKVDKNKLNLYLRYGEDVMNSYVYEMNLHNAYVSTPQKCKSLLGHDDPDVEKYDVKADTSTTSDDNAKITISSGEYYYDFDIVAFLKGEFVPKRFKAGTYGYDSGFIFTTYPRYDEDYIIGGEVTYDYRVDKDIELIVENIESRQDYINFMLGYPNEVNTLYSYNSSVGSGAVCTFNVGGENLTDIKVRLLHAPNNAAIPDVGSYAPIEGQELVNFDKYILGVTYAENGGAPTEALKAQAIATASYILSHANKGNNIKLKKENGQNILEVSNSTFNQTYCDPDKGCYICTSPVNSTIQTVLTAGTVPEGASCQFWKGPLSESSSIRTAVREVSGMMLVDSSGNIASGNYTSETQRAWNTAANNGSDYIEILRATYGSAYSVGTSNCSFQATGNWASWRQFSDPWASKYIGSKTMKQVGCLITANAMMLANSGKSLTIPNFNPGTYLDLLKSNTGTLSGNALYNDKAIEVALGNHNYSYNSEPLYGSYESKVARIAEKLNQGYHVIISVKNNGHWIYVTGVSGNIIYMADPASSKVVVTDRYDGSGIAYIKYVKFY